MKHRLPAAILSLMLLVTLFPFSARAEGGEAVVITDPAGLLAIAQNPDGDYLLGADIDMDGVDWKPFAFSGTLEGDGHTIYNLTLSQAGEETRITYDGRHRGYHTLFAALFSSLSGTVQNVSLLNVRADLSTDQPYFLAGIAGYLAKGTISNCSVTGRLKIDSTAPQCGAGGIAGFGKGMIDGCKADCEITIVTINPEAYCEEYLGGILANGSADVQNCSVKLAGFTSVRGYVHNGGIVGLSDINPENKRVFGVVRGCQVDAVISFFEDVADRRAYCSAYVGEIQNDDLLVSGNETIYFESRESKDFSRILLPDSSEHPVYNAVITAPRCAEFGYTTYTNPKTGYSYRDHYTAPAHTPDEWKVITPPTYETEGIRRQSCAECGEMLREETIPVMIASRSLSLDQTSVRLPYRGSIQLTASVLPQDATQGSVNWTSSDESILHVDDGGLVTALGTGKAAVYCKTEDGFASAACEVEVYFTPGQWFTRYILFGWIWET